MSFLLIFWIALGRLNSSATLSFGQLMASCNSQILHVPELEDTGLGGKGGYTMIPLPPPALYHAAVAAATAAAATAAAAAAPNQGPT